MFALVLGPVAWVILILVLLSLVGLVGPWPSGLGARPGYYYPAGLVWVLLLIILVVLFVAGVL